MALIVHDACPAVCVLQMADVMVVVVLVVVWVVAVVFVDPVELVWLFGRFASGTASHAHGTRGHKICMGWESWLVSFGIVASGF